MKQGFIGLLFCFIFSFNSYSQHTNFLLGRNYSSDINRVLYISKDNAHTSFKPIVKSNLNFRIDSIIDNYYSNFNKNWFLRKVFLSI